jgi:signal peptidase
MRDTYGEAPGTPMREAGASTRADSPFERSKALRASVRWTERVVTACLVSAVALLALTTIGARLFRFDLLTVYSGSMAPRIPVGSLELVHQVAADRLGVGDVIAFHPPHHPGEVITHRIVAVRTVRSRRVFLTKGDANGAPDAWLIPGVGTGWHYVSSVQRLGYVFGAFRAPRARLPILAMVGVAVGLLVLVPLWRAPPRPC